MKIKKITAIFTCLMLVLCCIPIYADEINSVSSYILIEARTGTVLEEKDSQKELNCGYLSKLMSLLIIAEDIETGKYKLDDVLTAPNAVTGTKGSVVWLEAGDKMTVEELLKSVIIGNANDALTVLAVASQQNIENFTSEMNRRAFDLGLRNTVFMSPHGYYNEKEYTTAHDMAIICSELSRYEFLEPYFKTWRDFLKEGKTELVNENTLSRTYKSHLGYKAAHSEQSGYCIAEAGISNDGNKFIAVVLGADDEDTMFSTAKKLVNKGFNEYKVTVPGFLDELLLPMKVKHGVDSAVELELKSQNSIVIPRNVSELSNVVVLPQFVSAPIKRGQKIGCIGFYNKDTLVYETEIIAKNDVDKTSMLFVFKKMLLNLLKKC